MENKNIDTTLNTLRKHSPNWIDEIRNYINRLEKALSKSTKEIEELRDNNNQLSKSNNVWFHNFRDLTKEKTKLKSKPQTQRDDIFKEILTELKRAKGTTMNVHTREYLQQLIYFVQNLRRLKHLKQKHKGDD